MLQKRNLQCAEVNNTEQLRPWVFLISYKHSGNKMNLQVNTYDMIYLLTAIGLSPDNSSTVHIYTQTIHGTT